MPYIKPEHRPALDAIVDQVIAEFHTNGEMNYLLTRIVTSHYNLGDPNYAHLQTAVGLLECVKLELYRRAAAPYEEAKIRENGDVQEYEKDQT